ncbi:hypothetical protein [Streptomyces paludis]|uniref:DUF2631 domain-containing protein n=1 Tax=Streptomyces paludis TaxID=2282738 RepID=A0A345HSG9_9ACTN|nr:hypothetical protein [Streptomyces paludis]AXG79643.1 hypothetical protein DVK44_20560 [Streptomyces paludis]
MTPTEPYRPATAQQAGQVQQPAGASRDGLVRNLLWAVVVLSSTANVATNFGSAPAWTHLASGLVTTAAVAALVIRARRQRRRR